MKLFSNSVLESFSELNLEARLEPGRLLGRGFADLGFELFSVVGPSAVVSLFTGQRTEVNEQAAEQMFAVLELEDLISELDTRAGEHVPVRREGAEWTFSLAGREFRGPELLELLLQALTISEKS